MFLILFGITSLYTGSNISQKTEIKLIKDKLLPNLQNGFLRSEENAVPNNIVVRTIVLHNIFFIKTWQDPSKKPFSSE